MNEKILKAKPGIPMLILFIALYLVAVGLIILGAILLDSSSDWGAIPFVVWAFMVYSGHYPVLWVETNSTAGSACANTIRQIHRHS